MTRMGAGWPWLVDSWAWLRVPSLPQLVDARAPGGRLGDPGRQAVALSWGRGQASSGLGSSWGLAEVEEQMGRGEGPGVTEACSGALCWGAALQPAPALLLCSGVLCTDWLLQQLSWSLLPNNREALPPLRVTLRDLRPHRGCCLSCCFQEGTSDWLCWAGRPHLAQLAASRA